MKVLRGARDLVVWAFIGATIMLGGCAPQLRTDSAQSLARVSEITGGIPRPYNGNQEAT